MKKYTNTLLALLLAGTFAGCGSNNDTEVIEEANTTTSEVPKEETTSPVQTEEKNQKMPTCYIKRGTPVTESLITVHAKCKNGNIPIDEAKVTLDNTVKSVDYKGTYFSDYIGFSNLQPNTTYKAVLEVVVGGKIIKKSVKIKTKEEKVEVTPTPTPKPTTHTAPKWNKKVYTVLKGLEDTDSNKINLNLKGEVSSEQGDKITFKVLSNSYKILDDSTCLQDHPFIENESITTDGNKLIVKYFPPCVGIITSVVQAKSIGGTRNTTVKINFEPTPWMPIGNTPPVWTEDSYEIGFRSLNFPSDGIILDLNKLCSAKGDITYKIVSSHLQTNPTPEDRDYILKNELTIDNGKLKLARMPYNGGLALVIIRATSNNESSDTNVNITLEPLYMP